MISDTIFYSILAVCAFFWLSIKMTKPRPYAAYTVFRGKKPGVYRTWEECQQQIDDYPKNKYIGYDSLYEAQFAWAKWEEKLAVKLGASTFLQQAAARPKMQPVSYERMNRPRKQAYDLPPLTAPGQIKKSPQPESSSPIPQFKPSEQPLLHNTPPSSPPLFVPGLKRSVSYPNISDDEYEAPSKRYKVEDIDINTPIPALSREERFELAQLENQNASGQAPVVGATIQLTPEQEKVVKLALQKNNIFLTGAAGSGKTVTLKAILERIRQKKKGGNVEVVAPTGIAALPLGGKTTYSLAGVSCDHIFNFGVSLLTSIRR